MYLQRILDFDSCHLMVEDSEDPIPVFPQNKEVFAFNL